MCSLGYGRPSIFEGCDSRFDEELLVVWAEIEGSSGTPARLLPMFPCEKIVSKLLGIERLSPCERGISRLMLRPEVVEVKRFPL